MLSEVVVASTAGSSVHGSGGVYIYDALTGSSLHSFKGSSGISGGCSVVPSTKLVGGIVATPQSDKGVLNVYSWQKVCLLSKSRYRSQAYRSNCILKSSFHRNSQRGAYHPITHSALAVQTMVEYFCGK